MLNFIYYNFRHILEGVPKPKLKDIKSILMEVGNDHYKRFHNETVLEELFSESNDSQFPYLDEEKFVVAEPSYIHSFLILYLIYLNKLISSTMSGRLGNKNIGYAVSIEKKLMDIIYGSEENLKKLFVSSGFLSQENEYRKMRIFTRGEGCHPAIRNNVPGLKFKIKSYFVTAQIYKSHIHVALHQVVQTSSAGENSATIVLKDKLLYMDDVDDVLYRKIWSRLLLDCHVGYCSRYHAEKGLPDDFCSLQNYFSLRPKIKSLVLHMVRKYHSIYFGKCNSFTFNNS